MYVFKARNVFEVVNIWNNYIKNQQCKYKLTSCAKYTECEVTFTKIDEQISIEFIFFAIHPRLLGLIPESFSLVGKIWNPSFDIMWRCIVIVF